MFIAWLISLSFHINLTLTGESFGKIYRCEQDIKTKERMLLVLNVMYQGKVPAQVARDLHRCKSWAGEWLKRYDKEGIDGLKTRQKSGRPMELSEEISYQIRKELKESNKGWTTKQVEELIVKKSGIKYHYTHIYRILRKWGFKQKVPRKIHANTASTEEKDNFKKRPPRYLWTDKMKKKKKRKKDLR
jgi:putative transposase